MLQNDRETIVAQATPPGYGGVGVVRVSGARSRAIAEQILGTIPSHRLARYSTFFDSNQIVLDQGIALFFEGPHSFTGEDVLELQGHGGPVVMQALIQTILSMGARLAEPGEFSLRAFLNNKIDLVQAEAVADLIHAHSLQAARGAMRSLQGDFSKAVQAIVDDVIRLRVFVESMIDFPEEAIETLQTAHIAAALALLKEQLETLITQADQGALIARGASVMIMGLPNAGKSSLLNALSAHDTAIVTDIPGTTRDIVRSRIHCEGMVIELLDTAGLRKAQDAVEQEGIRRALEAAAMADHIVWVIDANAADLEEDPRLLLKAHNLSIKEGVGITVLYNKMDLKKTPISVHECQGGVSIPGMGNRQIQGCMPPAGIQEHLLDKAVSTFCVSAKTGDGLLDFKQHLKKTLGFAVGSEQHFSARTRHLEGLKEAKHFIEQAILQSQTNSTLELVAEELRAVQRALEVITGRFSSDALLTEIFSTFCIGK
jgi:tRNA modification GTPase